MWRAAQNASSVSGPRASGWSWCMTQTYSPSYSRWCKKGCGSPLCARAVRSASTDGKWPNARSQASSSSRGLGSRVVSGTTRRVTRGASFSRISDRPGISSAAVASAMASTKLVLASAGTNSFGISEDCSCASASRTAGQMARARGVGAMPWPLRCTSSSPRVSRRRRSALLTAGWVSERLRAARVRLPSAMTSSKTRSKLRSSVRKLGVLTGAPGLKNSINQFCE